MEKMLQRLVGEHIEMKTTIGAGLPLVKADHGQLEQVILNLVVNARDAMPTGGLISIETATVHLKDGVSSPYLAAPPGDYVLLAVRDTGGGMTPEVLEHVFEPFFTTKGTGKGTGLGLATIYGIVKQHNGGITVESSTGRGSTFKIYFLRADGAPAADAVPAPSRPVERSTAPGRTTILVVEDDPGIRELSSKILRRYGYDVLSASGGDEARDISEHHAGAIDLLLSDVMMPGMNGPMVAEMLTKMRPGLKVVFMSGYIDSPVVRQGVMERDLPFVQKPFTPERLANKIVEVLG
jgi:CheY-like chemotaxis protein